MDYPKMLYLKGWEDVSQNIVVADPEEESAARKKGYKDIDEKPKRTRKRVVKDGDK